MQKMKSLILGGILLFAFAITPIVSVSAVSSDSDVKNGVEAAKGSNSGMASGNLTSIIGIVVNTMLFIVGVLAVIMIIYSGIRYTTSGGNSNSVTAAKNTLIYSIVGLVVAIIAYALVNWVLDIF